MARRPSCTCGTCPPCRRRLASAILPGLTLEELAERTGRPLSVLATVLREEMAAGRVVTAPYGRFALLRAEFPPDLLAALQGLSAPDVAELANGNGHRGRANGSGGLDDLAWSYLSMPYC